MVIYIYIYVYIYIHIYIHTYIYTHITHSIIFKEQKLQEIQGEVEILIFEILLCFSGSKAGNKPNKTNKKI
jgi:hypothetical protein